MNIPGKSVKKQVRYQVVNGKKQIRYQVVNGKRIKTIDAVRDQVWEQVWNHVMRQVFDHVRNLLSRSLL